MTFPEVPPREPSTAHVVLVYTALRLGLFLFVAALMLVFVRGTNGFFLALAVAAVVSGIASYFLLQHQRAPLAMALDRRLQARRASSAAKTASEDAAADELRGL